MEAVQKEMEASMKDLERRAKEQQEQQKKKEAEENKKAGDAFLAENKAKEGVVALPSGLQYKILKTGEGKKPAAEDLVEVPALIGLVNVALRLGRRYYPKDPAIATGGAMR
jgi:FKBP-type peptidyl-prolyl cis-trans isomerase